MSRRHVRGPSEGTIGTIVGTMILIGAGIFAQTMNKRNEKLKTINTLNNTVLGYLNKKVKDGQIRNDEVVKIALKAKDNLEELIKVGCKDFIDTAVNEIRAKEILK